MLVVEISRLVIVEASKDDVRIASVEIVDGIPVLPPPPGARPLIELTVKLVIHEIEVAVKFPAVIVLVPIEEAFIVPAVIELVAIEDGIPVNTACPLMLEVVSELVMIAVF